MEELNIHWLVIGMSMIVIASYGFNMIAKKTNIPSVIMLIVTGFIIGQFVPLDSLNLKPVLETLGTIGLIMIVLEAALDLHLEKKKAGLIAKAFFIALILLGLTSLLIAMVIKFFFDTTVYNAFAYAIPLSIMSSAIIIPSVSNLSEDRKEFLIFESAFSDIMGIMAFFFLVDSASKETASDVAIYVSSNIAITLVISIIIGYAVVLFIQQVSAEVKLFLPIAILLLLYSLGKIDAFVIIDICACVWFDD